MTQMSEKTTDAALQAQLEAEAEKQRARELARAEALGRRLDETFADGAEKPPAILYFHGFLSSPASRKARLMKVAAEVDGVPFFSPDLNIAPLEVDKLLERYAKALRRTRLTVFGSSLGGFSACRFAVRFGGGIDVRTVLVNPCLAPWKFVSAEAGTRLVHGTERRVDVLPGFAKDFERLAAEADAADVDQKNALLFLSTADEVLDWHLAWKTLRHANIVVSAGDDHQLSRFEEYLPLVMRWVKRESGA